MKSPWAGLTAAQSMLAADWLPGSLCYRRTVVCEVTLGGSDCRAVCVGGRLAAGKSMLAADWLPANTLQSVKRKLDLTVELGTLTPAGETGNGGRQNRQRRPAEPAAAGRWNRQRQAARTPAAMGGERLGGRTGTRNTPIFH